MESKSIETLKHEINAFKRQLENLINERKMTDKDTVEISRELDKLIVTYQRLIMNKK